MRAAVYHGVGDVRIEDVPEKDPGPGEVKVRVAFNGICGSDLHEYYNEPMMVPTQPHPLTGEVLPTILGHEASGHVVAVGRGVDDLDEGDLIAIEPIWACGRCRFCLSGHYNLCETMAFHGYSTGGGGLAEYTVIKRSMAHKLPESLSAEQGALIEPLSVAYHAVQRAGVRSGDTAAVFGGGPIGIGALLALRALGVEVIVSEPSASRRTVVEGLGASAVIDPTAEDVISRIMELTNGFGVAATIDAAGVPASFDAGQFTLAKQGTFVIVATYEQPVSFNPLWLFTESTLRASTAYCNDFPSVISNMEAGAYPTEGWVTKIALDDLVTDGFEVLRSGDALKILVDMAGTS